MRTRTRRPLLREGRLRATGRGPQQNYPVPVACSHFNFGVSETAALDYESLREAGQVAATVLRDEDEVLYADAAKFWVVDAGLDGDDVAGDELVVGEGDAGGFVDLQPDPVPRAVEEALRKRLAFGPVVHVGLVARLVQHLGDLVVDVLSVDAGLYHGEGRL